MNSLACFLLSVSDMPLDILILRSVGYTTKNNFIIIEVASFELARMEIYGTDFQ